MHVAHERLRKGPFLTPLALIRCLYWTSVDIAEKHPVFPKHHIIRCWCFILQTLPLIRNVQYLLSQVKAFNDVAHHEYIIESAIWRGYNVAGGHMYQL